MIDPIDSLAFTLESNKGVYALLLGSGISFSAEIPTGEQITSELIRRLAHLKKQDCGSNPYAWYKRNFGEDPDYSILLCQLAKTQNDRYNMLKEFFEPSDEERQRGAKMPTLAHKAIAQLVSKGYIKVIITTNFDCLIEKALRDVEKSPIVISTRDLAENAFPIIHNTSCTIIKVNGDYLDPRIRNTYSELEKYDDSTNNLLDRVFDEFGLIICGWSAEWDIALRRAFERCKSHRFSTYWTDIREPNEKAKMLIDLRRANFITIKSADSFFHELAEKVIAIESYKRPHPISKQIAVARMKKYLANDTYRIELYDLLMQETGKLYESLLNEHSLNEKILSYMELDKKLHRFEYLTELVLAIVITGCYWGSNYHSTMWVKCIEQIANIPIKNGTEPWLRQYPALLLFYGGGIASLANNQYGVFADLLMKPAILDGNVELSPVSALITDEIINTNEANRLFANYNFNTYTAFSNYLFQFFREPLRDFLIDDNQYGKCFDKFEYLVSLQHAYIRKKQGRNPWGPIGCFGWRRRGPLDLNIGYDIEKEAMASGYDWPILRVGLFDGVLKNFLDTKKDFDEHLGEHTFGWKV